MGKVMKYGVEYSGSGGSGGGSHSYSTTEQEIGTWIDGTPLYEITVETEPSSSQFTMTCPTDIEIVYIHAVCRIYLNNRFYYKPLYATAGGISWSAGYIDAEPKYSRLNITQIWPSGTASLQQRKVWVTIHYTKSTS